MRSTIIGIAFIILSASAAIYAAIAPPAPAIAQPWEIHESIGYIEDGGSLLLFGAGDKKLWLRHLDPDGYIRWSVLGFATKGDYDVAIRNVGTLVKVRAYSVKSDDEEWLVPITIQLKTK
jgi:hypothetical protein